MIKPSIGRVVWFHKGEWDKEVNQRDQECAAIVSYVWNDTMVNLVVFDADGNSHSRTSIMLWQGEGDRPTSQAYCEWMPYQKGQAAKTEALEKELGR